MALDPERCEELVREWRAGEDLADARRRRYTETYGLAHGRSAEAVSRNIGVLMDVLADDEAWLLSSDPQLWRDVMLDLLHDEFTTFCILVEPAMGEPL